jgi:hypothetical protein
MSRPKNLLEPDSPAPHIWPHWRAAVRAWHVGRRGRQASRSMGQEPRGKGPGLDDLLRVGRVMRALDLIDGKGALTRHGLVVVDVALGLTPRCGDRGTKTLAERMQRHLRKAGIVAPPTRASSMARWPFTRPDGSTASHAYLEDSD